MARARLELARAFGTHSCLGGAYVGVLYALLGRHVRLRELLPRRAHRCRRPPMPPTNLPRLWQRIAVLAAERHGATAAQYCWQSVQKYALTEGERVVLVWLSPLAQQGVFALVSNLGSLVARLVLQPFEEAAFAHFSQADATLTLTLTLILH